MPQGDKKLKKPDRKQKPVRGDQQKLKHGNFVIKPTIGKKADQERAQQELTKKIQQRIERTMAARASTDGGGLQVLAAEAMEGGSDKRSLKPSLGVGRSGSSGGSALAKKKR